jgi:hypothetical protein
MEDVNNSDSKRTYITQEFASPSHWKEMMKTCKINKNGKLVPGINPEEFPMKVVEDVTLQYCKWPIGGNDSDINFFPYHRLEEELYYKYYSEWFMDYFDGHAEVLSRAAIETKIPPEKSLAFSEILEFLLKPLTAADLQGMKL